MLINDKDFVFRVSAVNSCGRSEPTETNVICIQDLLLKPAFKIDTLPNEIIYLKSQASLDLEVHFHLILFVYNM